MNEEKPLAAKGEHTSDTLSKPFFHNFVKPAASN
jgi:hypothetical protein